MERGVRFLFAILSILIISFSFVSASLLGDFFSDLKAKITGMAGGSDDTRTWILNSNLESADNWQIAGISEFTSLYTASEPDVKAYSGTKFAALKYCSTCYAKPSLKQTINPIIADSLAGEYELCAYGANLGGASRGHICFNGKCTATDSSSSIGQWKKYCVTNSVAKGYTINIELNAFDKTHYFAWDAVTITKKETPVDETPVYNEVCTDSDANVLDGGIYTYGCASLSGGPVASSKCDVCSTTSTVAETYCDGKSIKTNNILCPSGACKNGVCVSGEIIPPPGSPYGNIESPTQSAPNTIDTSGAVEFIDIFFTVQNTEVVALGVANASGNVLCHTSKINAGRGISGSFIPLSDTSLFVPLGNDRYRFRCGIDYYGGNPQGYYGITLITGKDLNSDGDYSDADETYFDFEGNSINIQDISQQNQKLGFAIAMPRSKDFVDRNISLLLDEASRDLGIKRIRMVVAGLELIKDKNTNQRYDGGQIYANLDYFESISANERCGDRFEIEIDYGLLDSYDKLIYHAKERGIQVNIALFHLSDLPVYSLKYLTCNDNWSARDRLTFRQYTIQGTDYFLANDYAKDRLKNERIGFLLEHVNPYTGYRWKDDPTISHVDIISESPLEMGKFVMAVDDDEDYSYTLNGKSNDAVKEILFQNYVDFMEDTINLIHYKSPHIKVATGFPLDEILILKKDPWWDYYCPESDWISKYCGSPEFVYELDVQCKDAQGRNYQETYCTPAERYSCEDCALLVESLMDNVDFTEIHIYPMMDPDSPSQIKPVEAADVAFGELQHAYDYIKSIDPNKEFIVEEIGFRACVAESPEIIMDPNRCFAGDEQKATFYRELFSKPRLYDEIYIWDLGTKEGFPGGNDDPLELTKTKYPNTWNVLKDAWGYKINSEKNVPLPTSKKRIWWNPFTWFG